MSVGRICVSLCVRHGVKGWGENMLRRTLQIVALCCGALGLTIPAQAQFRFSTEAIFMDRDNTGSGAFLRGPDSFSGGTSPDIQTGVRFTLGGSFDAYDLEFVGSHIDGWQSQSSGTLTNLLIFDDTANNPVVVTAPPANTLAFTNSLFNAATAAGIEDLESERLQAGAKYVLTETSQFHDYQVNIGTNPDRNNWKLSVGWRQMRLSENNSVGVTGIFDALDTATGAVNGDPGNVPNDGLSDGAITGAGYVLRSGSANGFDAFDLPVIAPDTLQLFYSSGTQNILNGVQVSGGYQLFPESVVMLEVFGKAGIYHNYSQGRVGEYLVGSGTDDSIYQRNFTSSRNGAALGGTLGLKAAVPLTDYITLTAGYEALYVANVALASAQLGGLSDSSLGERLYSIRNSDKLMMHGATLGMTLTW